MLTRRSKKDLLAALPQQCFWVNNGPILSDLRELRDAFENDISNEQFAHHVAGERNDFEKWVRDVLGDNKCADALKRAKTQKSAISSINSCLKNYNP